MALSYFIDRETEKQGIFMGNKIYRPRERGRKDKLREEAITK